MNYLKELQILELNLEESFLSLSTKHKLFHLVVSLINEIQVKEYLY